MIRILRSSGGLGRVRLALVISVLFDIVVGVFAGIVYSKAPSSSIARMLDDLGAPVGALTLWVAPGHIRSPAPPRYAVFGHLLLGLDMDSFKSAGLVDQSAMRTGSQTIESSPAVMACSISGRSVAQIPNAAALYKFLRASVSSWWVFFLRSRNA